ncbi:MAG: hypothetical protein AMJ46_01445 [Latescibacteria bacterium DG_63]|nr:MAG: hypothetical protein AMJ46_01445 [Latescibacteria bacterium DG_63]
MSKEASERNILRLFLAAFLVCLAGLWFCSIQVRAPGLCLALSLFLLLIAPGFIPALRLREKLGLSLLEVLPFAVSLSLAQAALLLLAFDWLTLSVVDARWALMLSALGWWLWARRTAKSGFVYRREVDSVPSDVSGRTRSLLTIGLVALLIVISILLLRIGAPLQWETDSVAHVAAIRGVVEEGKVFPIAQPYGPNGTERSDPRFGIFHALCAVVAVNSGVGIHVLWKVLPAFFAPLLLLAFFSAARAITGSTKAALVAALLFPLCYGGVRTEILRIASYPNRVSMLVYLISLGVFFRFFRDEKRWLLALLAILVATTAAIHVYYFIEFAFVTICFLVVKLIATREERAHILAKWVRGVGVAAAVSLPLLLYRFFSSYSTANPYAVEGQGILYLNEGLYILSPLKAYGWLGFAGIISIVLLPYFIVRARRRDSYAFITAATAGPLVLIFNPVLLPVATKVLSYLAWRLMWAVPYALTLGVFLAELPANFRLQTQKAKVLSVVIVLFVAWAVVGATAGRVSFYTDALVHEERSFTTDMAAISGHLERLDRELEGRRVVLSDPVTAYAISAFTRHFVTAIPVAHSAPTDSFPVSRVRDALDVLNPGVSLSRTQEILRKYRVEFVVLNTGFSEKLYAFEYEIDPLLQSEALRKILSAPMLFERVFSEAELHVFRVIDSKESELSREEVLTVSSSEEPLEGGDSVGSFSGLFSLESVEILPEAIARGDSLRLISLWKCLSPLPREDVYRLFVRLDTDFPRGTFFVERFDKLYRKLLERRTGERFRFREDVDPHSFPHPLHLWKRGEVVRQNIVFRIPEDLCPGTYRVEMNLRRVTPATNFHLSDFLQDRDYYSGIEVGSVELRESGRRVSNAARTGEASSPGSAVTSKDGRT